jgi:putative membrane protein
MKLGVAVATVTGLSLMIALLAYNDTAAIFGLVESVGWGLVGVVLVQMCILALAGIGWARLVQPFAPVPLQVYLLLRWLREAINVLLPVAQVGGDVIGGRLLTFWGVQGGLAAASILVDLLVQLATQLVFTVLGLTVLALSGADARITEYVAGGLVLSVLALAGFYFVQRSALVWSAEDVLIRATRRWLPFPQGTLPALHANLQRIHLYPGVLRASFIWHQAAWLLGVAEVWIALKYMGLRPGWGECLVLESLGQTVRSADFAIPGVMGVQEGGFLVIGSLYGLAPEVSLALSLVKRIPDLTLGVPGLLFWYLLETSGWKRVRPPQLRPMMMLRLTGPSVRAIVRAFRHLPTEEIDRPHGEGGAGFLQPVGGEAED